MYVVMQATHSPALRAWWQSVLCSVFLHRPHLGTMLNLHSNTHLPSTSWSGCQPVARPQRISRRRCNRQLVRSSGGEGPDLDELKAKFFKAAPSSSQEQQGEEGMGPVPLNPIQMGRQARRAFDEVWSQLSNLASPTKRFIIDDVMEPSLDAIEYAAPQAASTTVLVVGATGKVGRILTRKLLLRGYKVKALVRKREGKLRDEVEGIPSAVEVVQGDVGDMDSCQEAVRNVDKVCVGKKKQAG